MDEGVGVGVADTVGVGLGLVEAAEVNGAGTTGELAAVVVDVPATGADVELVQPAKRALAANAAMRGKKAAAERRVRDDISAILARRGVAPR